MKDEHAQAKADDKADKAKTNRIMLYRDNQNDCYVCRYCKHSTKRPGEMLEHIFTHHAADHQRIYRKVRNRQESKPTD